VTSPRWLVRALVVSAAGIGESARSGATVRIRYDIAGGPCVTPDGRVETWHPSELAREPW
jgi:hypothetical protein